MTATVDTTVSPLLAARQQLAAALEAATGYTAHPSYVEGFASPCIIITPNGWEAVTPTQVLYAVKVSAVVANQSGQLGDAVEELARLCVVGCMDASWAVPMVSAPGRYTVVDREYAGVQFEARALVTIREI